MRLTRQQLRDALCAAFDFDGLGIKPIAVDAAAATMLRQLNTGTGSAGLTRAQLRERAQQVASRFRGQVVIVAEDEQLAALARAWGVEVIELPSWHVKYDVIVERQSSHSVTVKAADAVEAARIVRQEYNGPGKLLIDEIEIVENV